MVNSQGHGFLLIASHSAARRQKPFRVPTKWGCENGENHRSNAIQIAGMMMIELWI